jgi:hypothetical protein
MKKTVLVLIILVLGIPLITFAEDVTSRQSFQQLQNEIDQILIQLQGLSTQLQNIQLTPGHRGIHRLSLDLSRLYTVHTSNSWVAYCNNDDVALSCGAGCMGAIFLIVNYPFGYDHAASLEGTYSDHLPGLCSAYCRDVNSEIAEEPWDISMLCTPRN